jgi:AraC-like DNA-binding protein
LARRVSLSRATFSKRFTRLVGRPPLAYLTWWRMTLAARFLQDGDRILANIAERVGYTSQYAFATTFKRHHGVPPGRYRRALLDRAGRPGASTPEDQAL